jgi:hypothetical protein
MQKFIEGAHKTVLCRWRQIGRHFHSHVSSGAMARLGR